MLHPLQSKLPEQVDNIKVMLVLKIILCTSTQVQKELTVNTSGFAGLGIQDPAPGGDDYVIKYLGFPLLLLSFNIFSGFSDSGKACSMK